MVPVSRILVIAILLLVSTSSVQAECLDWTLHQPVGPSVPWNGPFFHDIEGGEIQGRFMLKVQVEWLDDGCWTEHGYLYDISQPESPTQIQYFQNTGNEYVSGGMEIETVQDRRCVVRVPSYTLRRKLVTLTDDGAVMTGLGGGYGAALAQDHGFFRMINWPSRLLYYDLSDPQEPVLLGYLDGVDGVAPWALSHSRVLVESEGMVRVADFTDPARPILRGRVPIDPFQWLGQVGAWTVASTWTETWAIDTSDPDNLQPAWSLQGHTTALAVQENLLVLLFEHGMDDLRLFDLAGGTPVQVGDAFDLAGSIWPSLALHQNVLYTAEMAAFDLSNPPALEILGLADEDARQVAVRGDWLVSPRGLYPLHCSASSVPGPIASALVLRASPNPFNPRVELRFELVAGNTVRLAVHDLRGRRVRLLLEAHLAAGRHQISWDGRDQAGRDLPAGTYLARLRVGEKVSRARLALVR